MRLAVLDIRAAFDINCNAPNFGASIHFWGIVMKDKKYKIAVIGGDARQLIVGAELVRAGHDVALYGFGGEMLARAPIVDSLCCSHPSVAVREILSSAADGGALDCGEMAATAIEAVADSLAVILPLPSAADGNTVSMPLGGSPLKFSTLAEIMSQNGVKYVCGGKLPADFAALCAERGIAAFDYYESDAFSVANAIPSAEGAIEIAMRELNVTLNGSSALVIGYGRIGKVLSRLLSHLGVAVTASARKPSDLAWIRADGHVPAETGKLCELFANTRFNVIFNTVPHNVLGEAELLKIPLGTLIVDLASRPGGVDIAAADRMKHNVIWALSLPGKVAPVTSGKIIADAVIERIVQWEAGKC